MNVRIRVLFKPLTHEDWEAMRSVASELTNNAQSIRVLADEPPGWLAAEFTMRTEAQSTAVETIGEALELYAGNRQDSTIQFPYTPPSGPGPTGRTPGKGRGEEPHRRGTNRPANDSAEPAALAAGCHSATTPAEPAALAAGWGQQPFRQVPPGIGIFLACYGLLRYPCIAAAPRRSVFGNCPPWLNSFASSKSIAICSLP